MADRLAAADRALGTHPSIERREGTFAARSTPFDATIHLDAVGQAVRYAVRVELPTLDAVVADESVAAVIRDGWFETLRRRLENLGGALRSEPDPPTVERDDRTGLVVVTLTFDCDRPDHGAEDAVAAVGYVEGTYLEGVIPGYTYREPVAGLLDQARERSGA